MSVKIESPFPIFTDIDGNPLEDGYVYIGEANLDPEVSPINVYWDAELTALASQPIRTIGGYPSNSGEAGRIYLDVDYSITIRNKNGSLISTIQDESISGVIKPVDTIADLATVDINLYETVNVRGYYAANDGGGDIFNYDATQSAVNNGGTIIDGWVRQFSGAVHTKWFGAKCDATVSTDGTDDTTAIQAAIDFLKSSPNYGELFLDEGVSTVTQLEIIDDITVTGVSGGIDADRTILNGSWLKLKDSAGITSDEAILKVTHDTSIPSTTNRTFCKLERFGIYGNRTNNATGHGILLSTKNASFDSISVYECAESGIVCRDETGVGNDGTNSSFFNDIWVGYNNKYGVDLRRDAYSGDFAFHGGHIFWNDDAGVYCDQLNVLFLGTHIWWNLDGVIVDGTNSGQAVQFVGSKIYDNAAAGIRLVNSIKDITIGGDIHGNGNEARWAFFSPPKTSSDISQNEQAGIYCNTDAQNIMVNQVNFGYLNDTGRQYYGLRNVHASATFSIGTVNVDGASDTQKLRAIQLTNPVNGFLHGEKVKSDMSHVGFISTGDINMNGNDISNQDKQSFWAWDVDTVDTGVLNCTSTTMALNEAAPVNVTSLTTTIEGQLPLIIIRNGGSNAVTFVQNTSFLRNISGANVVLAGQETIGYIAINSTTYIQVMGKI